VRLGIADHLGWAVAVTASGDHEVVDRRRIALIEAGVTTPEFFAFSELAFRELGAAEALPQIEERLTFPIVVKPAAQGSALGIKFARTADDVPAALVNAFSYDDKVLLERHIEGRELAVSMIEQGGGPVTLPIVEALPRDEDFFDFESRYEIGRTEYRCPPGLSDDETAAVEEAARATWRVLGCQGFARADIIAPSTQRAFVVTDPVSGGKSDAYKVPSQALRGAMGLELRF